MNHVKIQTKEQKNVTRHGSHDESLLCKWKYTRYFCFIDNNLSQIKIIIFSQHFRPRLTCTPPQHQPWPWCTVLSAWSGSMGTLWETEGQDRRSEWIRTHRTAADEHWLMKSWQHGDWLLFSVCILSCVFWMLSRLCSLRDLSSWDHRHRGYLDLSDKLDTVLKCSPLSLWKNSPGSVWWADGALWAALQSWYQLTWSCLQDLGIQREYIRAASTQTEPHNKICLFF